MTVQKDVTKNIYVGNGSTRTFPFTFECPAEHPEYIKVYLMQDDGTALATSDYQLDMDARQITYPSIGAALPEGKKLVIMRELPLQQMMNLVNNGPYFAEDVELAFDENVMAMQQIAEKLNRSIIMSVDIDGDAFVNEVPFEAGKSFRIADDGKSIVLTEDPGKVIDEAKGLLAETTIKAEETATNAQEAKQAAAEIKTIYSSGGLTPITDLAGSIGTAIKRWGYIFANKVFAMNLPIVYKNIAEMKADSLLSAGMTACTLGYYAINDGGGAAYIIRAKQESDVDDGGSLHELANGNVAELVVENGTVNVKQFGAKGDGVTDDKEKVQNAINYSNTVEFPKAVFLIDGQLNLRDGTHLFGDGTLVLPQINMNNNTEVSGISIVPPNDGRVAHLFDIGKFSGDTPTYGSGNNIKIHDVTINATYSVSNTDIFYIHLGDEALEYCYNIHLNNIHYKGNCNNIIRIKTYYKKGYESNVWYTCIYASDIWANSRRHFYADYELVDADVDTSLIQPCGYVFLKNVLGEFSNNNMDDSNTVKINMPLTLYVDNVVQIDRPAFYAERTPDTVAINVVNAPIWGKYPKINVKNMFEHDYYINEPNQNILALNGFDFDDTLYRKVFFDDDMVTKAQALTSPFQRINYMPKATLGICLSVANNVESPTILGLSGGIYRGGINITGTQGYLNDDSYQLCIYNDRVYLVKTNKNNEKTAHYIYSTGFMPTAYDSSILGFTPAVGCMVFNQTLGKPVWWNGTNWCLADGSTVNF